MVEQIEAPLEYPDRRSPRVRDLIGMGLGAERGLRAYGIEFESGHERDSFVEEAVTRLAKKRAEIEDAHADNSDETPNGGTPQSSSPTVPGDGGSGATKDQREVDVDREFAKRLAGNS